jgi:hypothetical protein
MVVSNVFADTTAEKEAKRIRSQERMYKRFGVLCVVAVFMIVLAGQSFSSEVGGECIYKIGEVKHTVSVGSGDGIEAKISGIVHGKHVFYNCAVLTANGRQLIQGEANRGGK